MKKTLAFIYAFILAEALSAQVMRAGLYGGFSLYPSTGPDRMMIGKNGSSLDRFITSYNAGNASLLSQPLTTLKMRPSLHLGMNFMAGGYYSEIAYNSLHGRSKAEFYNGNKRVLDVKQRDLDIGMGFGFNRSAFYIYLVGVLSFGFGDRLEAWTEYADGTKSFGNENYLNGIYEVGARLSARPALRIGISPTDRITLMFSLDKLREGSESNYYTDNFAGDLFVEGGSDNSEIGVDWLDYVNDMSGYILEDRELLRSGWSGLQMRFGICFNLLSEEL